MKHKKHYFKGFTLVELIIVITILAILSVIAFVSFQNFTKDTRDSTRITDMANVKKALELYSISSSTYPVPDSQIWNWVINGQPLIYVWEFWDENSRVLKFNKWLQDPLTHTSYVYGTNADQTEYQIASILEWDSISYSPFIETTYANISQAKVEWNYKWFIKFNSGSEVWIANIPSLLFSNTGSVELLNDWTYYIVNNKSNLPYDTSWNKSNTWIIQKITGDDLIKEITKSPNASLTWVNITNVTKDNFDEYFTGNTLESFNIHGNDIRDIENNQEVLNTIKNNVKSLVLWWGVVSAPAPAPKTDAVCWVNADTFLNSVNDFTNKDDNSYCERWTPDNKPNLPSQWNTLSWNCISPDGWQNKECSATKLNPNTEEKACSWKPENSKYYDWADTHSVTVNFWNNAPDWEYSESPSENSCDFSCNNNFHYEWWSCISNTESCDIENWTWEKTWNWTWWFCIVKTCNWGHYKSWNSCLAYVNWACTDLPTNAVFFNWTTSYSLTNANNWTTKNAITAWYKDSPASNTCEYKCNSDFYWENWQCKKNIYKCFNNSNAILQMELTDKIYYYCGWDRSFNNSYNPYKISNCLTWNNWIKWISPTYWTEWWAIRYETTDVTTKNISYTTANYNQYKCNAWGNCNSYSSIVTNMANGFNKDAYKVNLCEYSNDGTLATTDATAYYLETTNGSRWEILAYMFGNNSNSRQVTVTHYLPIRSLGSQSFGSASDLSQKKYWVEVRYK